MATKKNENPFTLILEEMQSGQTKSGSAHNFRNLLKSNNKRIETRTNVFGHVDVFDDDGKLLTRAVMRNVSPGGLGLEILPVVLTPQMTVYIEIGGAGADLGRVKCSVSWVASIDKHARKHKMIGLRFESKSAAFKVKLEKFIGSLSLIK